MAVYTSIDNPGIYFNTITYTGNGSATRTITGAGFQPDLIINKDRGASNAHFVWDAVRGNNMALQTNDTVVDSNVTSDFGSGGMGSAASDGFNIVSGTSNSNNVNSSSNTFVAWCWKESADSGMDIVTYTGNGSNRTIAHSLSAEPHWMLFKSRSDTYNWVSYQKTSGNNNGLVLNSTAAHDSGVGSSYFNSTDPDSDDFSLGTAANMNGSSKTFVSYLFAPKQGFSQFGTYTTNNDADGPFVFTGFRPAYLLLKVVAGNTGGWDIYDNKRATGNGIIAMLQANANSAEATSDAVDLLSNGFKIRNTSGNQNGSGDTIFYAAFAEAPFVNSNGVPCNAR